MNNEENNNHNLKTYEKTVNQFNDKRLKSVTSKRKVRQSIKSEIRRELIKYYNNEGSDEE